MSLDLGAWLHLDSVLAAEVTVRSGFDWAAVDLQHGVADPGSLVALLAAIRGCGVPAWVRTRAGDHAQAAWALDMGADVVVIPQIGSGAQAAEALASCRYADGADGGGHRSWGPVRAALRPASAPPQRVYLMIEDADGLAAAEQICAQPGLDGILIGPADLSLSLTGSVDPHHPDLRAAAAGIVDVARRHDLHVAAYAGSVAMVPVWTGLGVTTIALAADTGLIAEAAAAALAAARA